MFTGIIETTGRLRERSVRGPGTRVEIATSLAPLGLGESISVSGVCLTVAAPTPGGFAADLSAETAERTTLGGASAGAEVNLERSLAVGDRLGGHWVSGHVDGVARVTAVSRAGEALRVSIGVPEEVLPFIAPKGSVALDGVSLTVNRVSGASMEVMLIPHTLEVTTLKAIAIGRAMNLEVDLLARYVARWLETRGEPRAGLV